MNCITAKTPEGARIAMMVDTDREALDVAIACCLPVDPAAARIARILDTKHLEWFFATRAAARRARRGRNERYRRPDPADRLRRRGALPRRLCDLTGSPRRHVPGSRSSPRPRVLSPARLTHRLAALPSARRGGVIFICSGLVFVATDSLTKTLVSNLPVIDVVFGRHVTYLAAVILLAGRRNPRRLLSTARLGTQLARGLANFGATATFFLSLSLLPLAEVSTLASTTPLIVVALAGPLLGERISRLAVLGAIVGFGGVVALSASIRASLNPALLVPLGTAARTRSSACSPASSVPRPPR